MADNLTVGSPGAGHKSGAADRPEGNEGGAHQLEQLRELAKKRTGRDLTDAQLAAIVERVKLRAAERARGEETKAQFEAERGKEAVSSKEDVRAKSERALAAKDVVSAKDGLTAKDRQSITSDPDAGPKLPPAAGQPANAEQAGKLLESMTSMLQMGELPFDAKDYAQSLSKLPPSRPKNEGATRRGEAKGRPAPLPRTASAAQPLDRRGAGGTLQTTSSAQSAAATRTSQSPGRSGTPGMPAPMERTPSAARGAGLAGPRVELGTSAAGQRGATPEMPVNTGGGLGSSTSFDAMTFNWDGFFALFMMRSEDSMQAWRKAMKQLRYLTSQAEIAGHDLGIELMKMRQQFARFRDSQRLGGELDRAKQAYNKGVVQATTGREPARLQGIDAQIEELLGQRRGEPPDGAGRRAALDKAKKDLELYYAAPAAERDPAALTKLEQAYAQAFQGSDPEGYEVARTRAELRAFQERSAKQGKPDASVRAELAQLRQAHDEALRAQRQRAPFSGRLYLTEAEREQLEPAQRERYEHLLSQRRLHGGAAAEAGMVRAEQARLRATGMEREAESLEPHAGRLEAELTVSIGKLSVEQYKLLLEQRDRVSSLAVRARRDAEASEDRLQQLEKGPPEIAAAHQARYDRASGEEEEALYSLSALDSSIRATRPMGPDTQQEIAKLFGDAQSELTGARKKYDEQNAKLDGEGVSWEARLQSEPWREARATLQQAQRTHNYLAALLPEGEQRAKITQEAAAAEKQRREQLQTQTNDKSAGRGRTELEHGDALALVDAMHGTSRAERERQSEVTELARAKSEGDAYRQAVAEYNIAKADRDVLRISAERGQHFASVRDEFDGPPLLRFLSKWVGGAAQASIIAADNLAGNLPAVTDDAVNGAIGMAQKFRSELDAMMRQGVSQSQGMINQLIQLLGMSRST